MDTIDHETTGCTDALCTPGKCALHERVHCRKCTVSTPCSPVGIRTGAWMDTAKYSRDASTCRISAYVPFVELDIVHMHPVAVSVTSRWICSGWQSR